MPARSINTATATATLPGCTGTIGSATCPTVPSEPSSTKTPTAAPALPFTGVDARWQLALGGILLLLGIGLGRADVRPPAPHLSCSWVGGITRPPSRMLAE